MNKKPKVILGLSGGVDSSVCAYLLQKQGYQVEALFMQNWQDDENLKTNTNCSYDEDLKYVEQTVKTLGIKLHKINFSYEYYEQVFKTFLTELEQGFTPNPDVLCNKEIKFKAFLDYANNVLGADLIATGHYAGILKEKKKIYLTKGLDQNKDQSYFLSFLNQNQLKNTIFPLSNYLKKDVKKIAKELGLMAFDKKESMGICFIGQNNFASFIKDYIKTKQGKILDLNGNFLANHQGLIFYTIGQRKGLQIGGIKNTTNEPWFVIEKDVKNNILIVAQGIDNKARFSKGLMADNIHLLNDDLDEILGDVFVKIRYRQTDVKAFVSCSNNKLEVIFQNPQKDVAKGQIIAFYDKNKLLGAARICSKIN